MHWITGKLSDLVEINPPIKLVKGKEYPFVSMDVINPGKKIVEAKEYRNFSGGGARFQNNDTLFARITPCLENGKIAQVRNLDGGVGFGSTEFLVFRGKKGITDTEFVHYFVTNHSFRAKAIQLMVGTSGRQRVDHKKLSEEEFTIPPLSIQRKIAEILGSLDDKIELNRRMNETLEQMAMALYKHWFVDFGPFQDGEFVETELGLIPKGWTIQQSSDLVTIQTSSVNPAKNEERLFLHYSIPAYDERMLPVLEQGLEIKSNKYLIRKNSVLVSKLNPETYRIWTVYAESSQYERICSTEFIVYEPKKEIAWAFLNAYFRDESFKNEFRSHAAGTTGSRQRVTPRKTLEFKLVVPPDSILEQFNDMCSDYFKIQSKNIKENEMLTEIRDYLLPRLLSGEIEVGEAEEQVEEVLANA